MSILGQEKSRGGIELNSYWDEGVNSSVLSFINSNHNLFGHLLKWLQYPGKINTSDYGLASLFYSDIIRNFKQNEPGVSR